jgi:hypothetical protein
MKLGVCLAVLAFVALLASTTVSASRNKAPSAATLAKGYLAALGPAGAQITRAVAELRALPPTATARQVNRIVRAVASKLTPLQRALATRAVGNHLGVDRQPDDLTTALW